MTIKPQKYIKKNPNHEKADAVKIELIKHRKRQCDICRDLGLNPRTVHNVIYGLKKSARVDGWIEENLGLNLAEFNKY